METEITLSGMLGADPEVQATANRVKACFRMAVTRRELRDGRWRDVETTWMQVEAWNLLARNVAASLHKGDPVVVSGVLRTSRWIDERGTRHDRIFVTARHVGHDLALGTTAFERATGQGPAVQMEDEPAPERSPSGGSGRGTGDEGDGDGHGGVGDASGQAEVLVPPTEGVAA